MVPETVVDLTEEDLKTIQEAFENYIEGLPQTLEGISEELSGDFLASLMESWPREAKREKTERDAFRKRLYTRWGEGIEHLKLLITIAREVGSEIHVDGKKAADAPLSMNVLTRLHARGCQIAEEVVCLLEGGFADGAMARWRTLHEISAVSALIGEHGEELAERYIEHDGIESARAARQYQKYHSKLGLEAIAVDEIKEIEERATALKDKYGKEFGSSNGWAAKHVGISEPKIDQLRQDSKAIAIEAYASAALEFFRKSPAWPRHHHRAMSAPRFAARARLAFQLPYGLRYSETTYV